MENISLEDALNFNLNFCNKCKEIFSKCEEDCFEMPSLEENILNSSSKKCPFCFDIINMKRYFEMNNEISQAVLKYDYSSLQYVTNFSPLFEFFHWYLRETKTEYSENKLKIINVQTLRKIFKNFYTKILEDKLKAKFEGNGKGDLNMVIQFDFKEDIYERINKILYSINEDEKYKILPTDDKSKIKLIIKDLNNNDLKEKILKDFFSIILKEDNNIDPIKVSFKLIRNSFFITGNYVKLSREMGQTKWEKNGVRLCASSVDEEIRNYLYKYYNTSMDNLVLTGGGREDRDVRMLGNGRSFIYEVKDAKIRYNLNYTQIEKDFNEDNSLIKINSLKECDKNYYSKIKIDCENKIKKYIAVVWIKDKINRDMLDKLIESKNIKLDQKTPLRVIHKRVFKDREKEIKALNLIEKINDHFIVLEILSSAGTYIKEFIHSDLGRTKPSLGDILGTECDIIQLDVMDLITI